MTPRTPQRAHKTLIGSAESVPSLVEHCVPLSIREAIGGSPRDARSTRQILVSRPKAVDSTNKTSLLVEADLVDPANALLSLTHEVGGVSVTQHIQLTSSGPPFRWWFICPFLGIRVAKLYLPPTARRFGSRKFYGLVYRCQAYPKRPRHLSPDVGSLRRSRRRSLAKASKSKPD